MEFQNIIKRDIIFLQDDYDITDEFSFEKYFFKDRWSVSTDDVNINTFWKENYWTGLSFRYEDALCFLVGFKLLIIFCICIWFSNFKIK